MKRIMLSVVSTGLLVSAMPAHAQSTVTLYGLIDAGFGYLKTSSGNQYAMFNGNLSGDRWGLRGQEDLGQGLKAVFTLENGFDVGTGKLNQGSREFGRQAFVGLASDSLGTVRLGRGYDVMTDMVQGITADNYGSPFATPGDVDNNDNSARVSNNVKYISPVFAGLQFEAMYAFGGLAGTVGQGYTYGAAAAYNNGPLSLAAGYLQATNPSAAAGALRSDWTSPTMGSVFDGDSINGGYATAHTLAILQAGGQYVIGAVTVGASYSNAQYKPDGQSTFSDTEKYNSGKVFGAYQFTPALYAAAGYIYTAATGDTSAHYHQVSLGLYYSLSKRTDFYLSGAWQRAAGEQRNASGEIQSAVASIGSYGTDGGKSQEIALVGMRHKF
jgi:predicted porin